MKVFTVQIRNKKNRLVNVINPQTGHQYFEIIETAETVAANYRFAKVRTFDVLASRYID